MSQASISAKVVIRRKQDDLPRFVIISANKVKDWRLKETTTVEVNINGTDLKRRSLMRWGDNKWFISITETDCGKLGMDVGDKIELRMAIASATLPSELTGLIKQNKSAREKWESLTASQRRMLREEIVAAKQTATRERHARRALTGKK